MNPSLEALELQIHLALAVLARPGADREERVLTAWDFVQSELPSDLSREEQLALVSSLIPNEDDLCLTGDLEQPRINSQEIPSGSTGVQPDRDSASIAVVTPAIALAAGRSIFPTGLDKRPLWNLMPKKIDPKDGSEKPSWKPFQERRATPLEFESWQCANPPGYAMVTGAISGLITSDFDGEAGQALLRAWGIHPHRRTPSGGFHWDVRHPSYHIPTLNGKTSRELGRRFPGLDIRGDGGYVVAFGRNNRGPYEWLRDPEPDPFEMVPPEVVAFLRETRSLEPGARNPVSELTTNGAATSCSSENLTKVKAGERHGAILSRGGKICNSQMTVSELSAAMWQWNIENCDPPLGNDRRHEIHEAANYIIQQRDSGAERTISALAAAAAPPAPMESHAFYGLAGEFVRIVEPHSESDPAALLVQFVVAAGIFLGRHGHYQVEDTKHHTNLFAILVGDTARGRKGTAWGRVRSIFNRTDANFGKKCFASGLSSGEGLIFRGRDPVTEINFKKGGTAGVPVVVDVGIEDKRLCVVETEFSRVFKVTSIQTNILSDVIRDAWDGMDLDNLTKNSRTKATGAHIGIIGHITKEEVARLLTSTEAANGFGNRFLWLYTKRSKSLPFGGSLPSDALDGIREGLLTAADNVYSGFPGLAFDDAAAALWDGGGIYEALSSGSPGLVGALLGRAAPQVVRIALIFALLDCKRSISLAHLKAALAIWKYCEASTRFVFGESLGDDTADEIHRYLKTVGSAGATRTDISKLFNRNRPSAEISRALGALARHSLARPVIEQTGGGPAERWFSCE